MSRRYNIFISSTFKDMDAERDVIKYDVISLLNNRYLKYGVEFRAVDLRFGINTEKLTEEESQNVVLDVCLSMIDSSRPFFIALIGNRYGWIPCGDRMFAVLSRLSDEKRKLVADGKGCSVTELEILYGALGANGENIDRCLFFVRDSKSYDGMSEKQYNIYTDDHGDKLDSLKTRVYDLLVTKGKQNAYIPYRLSWDAEKKKFSNLDVFREIVFKHLCDEIDLEIENLSKPLEWYEYARTLINFNVIKSCDETIDLYDLQSIEDKCDRYRRLLISGSTGSGKSVLLAHLFQKFNKHMGVYPLISMMGVTPEVTSLNNILYLWITELEKHLSLKCTSDDVLRGNNPYKILYDRFYEIVSIYESKGIRIVCFLDGLSTVSKTELGLVDFLWLSHNVNLVCTCDSNSSVYDRVRKSVNHEINLDELKFSIRELVINKETSYGIMLPDYLERMMESDGVTPLYLNLFMIMISNMTAKDFEIMRSTTSGSEIEKINTYIVKLYQNLPRNLVTAFRSVVSFISDRISAIWLNDVVVYIASSRTGLRESDLELLLGSQWDELKFTIFMSMFRDFFYVDKITKQWSLSSETLCSSIATKDCTKELCSLVASYPNQDSMKRNYLAYYSVLAADVQVADSYLCTIDAYSTERVMGFWSAESISRICNEKEHLSLVSTMINALPAVSKIRFFYALINSLSIYMQKEWYVTFSSQYTELLDSVKEPMDIYALANILNSAALHFKLNIEYRKLYEQVVAAASAAYKKCFEIDPEYSDVKNMYKIALMSHADILCEKGDFNTALTILQSLDKI